MLSDETEILVTLITYYYWAEYHDLFLTEITLRIPFIERDKQRFHLINK